VANLVLEIPIVLPPAVLGVAMLETFGRRGLLGPFLSSMGVNLPFSPAAVVLAQVLVAAPLYVLTAEAAFRAVSDDLLLVARTLGAGPLRAWSTVALPTAAMGLLSGAGLAWARALGEFGATLMFAGNLPGRTQTLTLAIFQALESDLAQARAISAILVGVAVALLLGLRLVGTRSFR
ncbi:MAG: ABC transporter permease subunit, partial [Myxococcota bacterium]|jgi:molybdate transport system permease protein|nr:ABC transporter permease subunit [Myxococcota bacterium]